MAHDRMNDDLDRNMGRAGQQNNPLEDDDFGGGGGQSGQSGSQGRMGGQNR
jgi:hypothetical protein